MVTVKRVGVLSFGIISAILYAIIGLIGGLLMWGFTALLSAVVSGYSDSSFGYAFSDNFTFSGVFMVLVYPLLSAVIGFIGGVILAALYNLVSGWVGGIQLELKDTTVTVIPQNQQNAESGS